MTLWDSAKLLGKVGWAGSKVGFKGAKIGFKGLKGATAFSLRNPTMAAAIGLGAYGTYQLSKTGPGGTNYEPENLGRLAQQSDVSSTGFDPGMGASRYQESRAMFMDSTAGLVQGLHKGRHRG